MIYAEEIVIKTGKGKIVLLTEKEHEIFLKIAYMLKKPKKEFLEENFQEINSLINKEYLTKDYKLTVKGALLHIYEPEAFKRVFEDEPKYTTIS